MSVRKYEFIHLVMIMNDDYRSLGNYMGYLYVRGFSLFGSSAGKRDDSLGMMWLVMEYIDRNNMLSQRIFKQLPRDVCLFV